MPRPSRGDIHVDKFLTNLSIAFIQGEDRFVAGRVFPTIPVAKQSDLVARYDREDWMRSEAQKRAPGTESAGGGFAISNISYFADVFAVHKDVDDQTRANADQPINLDRDATRWTSQQCLLKREIEWSGNFFKTGIWGADKAGGVDFVKWDLVASDPTADIEEFKTDIAKLTGFEANTVVLGRSAFSALKSNAAILDRIKFTERGIITTDLLASLWDVKTVMVANAIQNTAAQGATGVFDFIHGDSVLLCHSAPNPGLMVPSAGYTFAWTGLFGAGAEGARMKNFRIERIESNRIECEMAWDQKVIAKDLGVFLDDVTG